MSAYFNMMSVKRFIVIILLNILGITIFCSWYLPENGGFWFPLDSTIFYWFNDRMVTSKPLLWFIALTNYRAFDAVSLLAMGGLYYSYWYHSDSRGRRRMFAIGITLLLTAVILNQLAHQLPGDHPSPTQFFPNVNHAAELTGLAVKDASANSFPGDHGMMLIIFAGFMWRYFGLRAFVIALAIFLIFISPRIMIGAHWLSDITVGSLSITLVGLSWWLMTPGSDWLVYWIDRYLPDFF